MSLLRSFMKDSVVYTVPSIVGKAISFVLVPLYTRSLAPASYGVLDLLMVFAILANLTIAFEVAQGMARSLADIKSQDEKSTYMSSALAFTVACYGIFLGLMVILGPYLAPLIGGGELSAHVFNLACLYIALNGIFTLLSNQLRWTLQSKAYALSQLSMSVFTALLAVCFVYYLQQGLAGILHALIGGVLLGVAVGAYCLRHKLKLSFDTNALKAMLTFSLPLVPSGMAVFAAYYIDRIMIRHYLALEDVGIYAIAFKIAAISTLFMVGFRVALTPLIYSHYKDPQTPAHLADLFRMFCGVLMLMFLGLSLLAPEILMVLATPDYYAAAPLVMYLVPAIILSELYIFAPGLDIEKKTGRIFKINLCGAIVSIVLNILLIPLMGLPGAALATLSGYIIVFTLYMAYSQKSYPVPHKWAPLGLCVLVACVLAASAWNLDMSLSYGIFCKIALIIAFAYLLFVAGIFRTSELTSFMGFLKSFSSRRS